MRFQLTELCLRVDEELAPFAVLAEHHQECAWAMASDIHPDDKDWLGHLLESAARRPTEWWVLDAWRDWLKDVATETRENRRKALRRLERSTAGLVVRRPRTIVTRLPAGAAAARWRRDRLFDRAEIIAAEIAANLTREGTAFWNAAFMMDGHEALTGDWVVEEIPAPGTGRVARGVALVHAIDAHHVPAMKETWAVAQKTFGPRYPYAVAVIRGWKGAEVADAACLIGERFAAPVSLAVATVRSKWYGT